MITRDELEQVKKQFKEAPSVLKLVAELEHFYMLDLEKHWVNLRPDQQEYLTVIRYLILENGCPPTYAEIGERFGINRASVLQRLKVLKEAGFVTWIEGQNRGLKLTKPIKPVNPPERPHNFRYHDRRRIPNDKTKQDNASAAS